MYMPACPPASPVARLARLPVYLRHAATNAQETPPFFVLRLRKYMLKNKMIILNVI